MNWATFWFGFVVGSIMTILVVFLIVDKDNQYACQQKGGQLVKGQCYKLEAIKWTQDALNY